MSKSRTTDAEQTTQTTLGDAELDDDREDGRKGVSTPQGIGYVLSRYGERYADEPGEPDPVRAASWVTRLQSEGVL